MQMLIIYSTGTLDLRPVFNMSFERLILYKYSLMNLKKHKEYFCNNTKGMPLRCKVESFRLTLDDYFELGYHLKVALQ